MNGATNGRVGGPADAILDDSEEQTVGDSTGSVHRARVWQVGDRVRVADGPRMLLGATGMVVEVDLPGAWDVRVHIDRAGFDRARLASHELKPVDGAKP